MLVDWALKTWAIRNEDELPAAGWAHEPVPDHRLCGGAASRCRGRAIRRRRML